jgi:hypothetical protein
MTSLLLKPLEQRLGAGDIMHLTGGDQEADREAIPIDPRMDLRGEAIELSIICTSPSCTLTMASITRSQMPALRQRLKRLQAVCRAHITPANRAKALPRHPEDTIENAAIVARFAPAKRLDDTPLEVGQVVAHDPNPDVS